MRQLIVISCTVLMLATPAHARKAIMTDGGTPPCVDGLAKTATISVNGSGRESTLEGALAAVEKQKKTLDAEITRIGASAKLTYYNYNLNMNTNMEHNVMVANFNYSTSLNYMVQSEEAAKKIANKLAEMKQQFSMSMNANSCNTPLGSD